MLGGNTLHEARTSDTVELLVESLPDARGLDIVPAVTFSFADVEVRYVEFQVLQWYGRGSGLQFFEVLQSETGIFDVILKK